MAVYAHIHKIFEQFPIRVPNPLGLIQDRGCQISYSLIGHNMDKEVKGAFDPRGLLRRKILEMIPLESDKVTVKVGGTTCLDYTHVDGTKADNLRRLAEMDGFDLTQAVYVGDQLYDGGNDSDVKSIEGLRTIQVQHFSDTHDVIEAFLKGE